VSGNILHHFDNWQSLEDGDPELLDHPRQSGVFGQRHVRRHRRHVGCARHAHLRVRRHHLARTKAGSLPRRSGRPADADLHGHGDHRIGVAPGSFDDWVGVDRVVILQAGVIPEPEIWSLTLLGLAVVAWARRRPNS
jgi:hypothetical protein